MNQMEMDAFSEIKHTLGKVLSIPIKELELKAYHTIIQQELQKVEIEIFKITQKHGIKTAKEMDE